MAEIYGHKWISSYGDKPNHAWTVGLEDITPESIKYGIEAIIKSGTSWPPSLPEFIDYCLGVSRELVIDKIHNKFVRREATYNQIEKAERNYFKETRKQIVDEIIWNEKQTYLANLTDEQLKLMSLPRGRPQ